MATIRNRVTWRWENPPNLADDSTYTGEKMKADLKVLNDKLNYAQKNINAWDFYKISQIVESEDEYQSKLNSLLPNTALMIKASKFQYGNETFSAGDIVYRMPDMTTQHIAAERGGTYYPKTVTGSSGTYNVTYGFSSTPPANGSITSVGVGSTAELNETITFTGLVQQSIQGVYGLHFSGPPSSGTWGSQVFNAQSTNDTSTILLPTIKFFRKTNNNYEEIIISDGISLSYSSSQFTLSGIPSYVTDIIIK